MFIMTESGSSINTDYIKSIAYVDLELIGDAKPFVNRYIIKAIGADKEEYYLKRCGTLAKTIRYIDDITRAIEASSKARRYNEQSILR